MYDVLAIVAELDRCGLWEHALKTLYWEQHLEVVQTEAYLDRVLSGPDGPIY